MKAILLSLFLTFMTVCMEQPQDSCPDYTGCRYAYFKEHNNLPDLDHELYLHFSKIVTFLDALAHKFGKTMTGQLKMNMGQTRQGLFLTSATPPAIITPWGRWLNLIFDEEDVFTIEQQREFWQILQKYIIVGRWEVKQLSPTRFICVRPILGYNDEKLPKAIFRPFCEFAKTFPQPRTTNPLHALVYQSTIDTQMLKALEYRHKNRQMTLKQLCLQAIQKEGLRKEKEEQKNA